MRTVPRLILLVALVALAPGCGERSPLGSDTAPAGGRAEDDTADNDDTESSPDTAGAPPGDAAPGGFDSGAWTRTRDGTIVRGGVVGRPILAVSLARPR